MEINGKIILLDLNYTLVSNQRQTRNIRPFKERLKYEMYRKDLIEAISDNYVIIITARPAYQGDDTLVNLEEKAGFKPNEAYFNDLDFAPPQIKESILKRFVFPRFGTDGSRYFAVESNPKTRAMYAQYGIAAEPYELFIKRFVSKQEGEENTILSLFDDF